MSDKTVALDILSGVELKEKSAQSNFYAATKQVQYCNKMIKGMSAYPSSLASYEIKLEKEALRVIKWSGEMYRFTGQVRLLKKLIKGMK